MLIKYKNLFGKMQVHHAGMLFLVFIIKQLLLLSVAKLRTTGVFGITWNTMARQDGLQGIL
jgi:hypothetical protein